MFIGGNGNSGGNSLMENLVNLKLMEATGILDKTKIDSSQVSRKIDRNSN